MNKTRHVYTCQACGYQTSKWLGRCADCGAWDSFVEEQPSPTSASSRQPRMVTMTASPPPMSLVAITRGSEERMLSGLGELDRVLGGGLVRGSLVLLGGDPGIGKSTLILQAAAGLSQNALQSQPILYISGEESAQQIRMRGDRLGINTPQVYILTETSIELIREQVGQLQPRILIVDSIQTIFTPTVSSAPGSVSQVRECTAQLMSLAKSLDLPIVIIGHVTKEGALAGPRVLEHMVDTVLYFEGERHHIYRILRVVKNRFGPTNEIGVFEMGTAGLSEVNNPSALFLAERPADSSGSVVIASMEGTRPFLVELQALGSPSGLGVPRRVANGVDPQRVALLLAVLEKRLGVPLYTHDVYVNVVGGLRLEEPALDLGVIVAVVSSLRDYPLDPHLVVCGEIGLTGEVRAVGHIETRLREAAKLGFRRCLLPQANCQPAPFIEGVELIGARTVAEALEAVMPSIAETDAFTEDDEREPVAAWPQWPRGEKLHGTAFRKR